MTATERRGDDSRPPLLPAPCGDAPDHPAVALLAARLDALLTERGGRAASLLVTGGERSAVALACRLASAFAAGGWTTIFVDADLAAMGEAPLFPPPPSGRGLADWLRDERGELPLYPTVVERLSVVPRGIGERGNEALLRADRVERLSACLAQRGQRIVWAGPGVTTIGGVAIARAVDGVVMAVSLRRGHRAAARSTRDALGALGAPLLGTVMVE